MTAIRSGTGPIFCHISEDRVQRTEFRGQRLEKTEDRQTERSVFRFPLGAKRRMLICLLSSVF
ncbi:MAG: hypothetical protein LBD06_04525 [Candidatus Accumulibacter sp.]|nr:hypothetical protein [Accumulibacter sp.]